MTPDIGETIRGLTLSNPDITALVEQRMYTDALAQDALMPAIAYWITSGLPAECLDSIADISSCEMIIECYGRLRKDTVELADLVRLQLEMYRGEFNGQMLKGITMTGGPYYGFDRPLFGTDQRRFIMSQDFRIFYTTTVPA